MTTKESINKIKDIALDLIRIYVGLFIFLKGVHFLVEPEMLTNLVEGQKILVWNSVIAHYVVLAHLSGGILILFGLLTRIASIAQIPILVGAVFMVHLKEGFFGSSQNLEYATIMLFLLILISIIGPGPLSVDNYVLEEARKQRRVKR